VGYKIPIKPEKQSNKNEGYRPVLTPEADSVSPTKDWQWHEKDEGEREQNDQIEQKEDGPKLHAGPSGEEKLGPPLAFTCFSVDNYDCMGQRCSS